MKQIIIIIALALFANGHSQNNDGSFAPLPGKKYIVSGWVKEDHTQQQKNYTSSIKVEFLEGTGVVSSDTEIFYTSGKIIDGWQRILGIAEIPNTYAEPSISIELVCGVSGIDCYFDDIRFFPYDGNLKSFVYDEESQRLMAELDENNYATFYEYDLEGGLVRVKKETEKGVFTIQETRSGNTKE